MMTALKLLETLLNTESHAMTHNTVTLGGIMYVGPGGEQSFCPSLSSLCVPEGNGGLVTMTRTHVDGGAVTNEDTIGAGTSCQGWVFLHC